MVGKKYTTCPIQPIVMTIDAVRYGKGTRNGIENAKNSIAAAE
jgi:hypothetical protein